MEEAGAPKTILRDYESIIQFLKVHKKEALNCYWCHDLIAGKHVSALVLYIRGESEAIMLQADMASKILQKIKENERKIKKVSKKCQKKKEIG